MLLLAAHGQARPGCQVVPKTLAAMHGCYRPLLVFSPSATDSRLRRQSALLDDAADDMMDRFVLFTPLPGTTHGLETPLDAPYTVVDAQEKSAMRARFHVAPQEFEVLLLNEDGAVVMHSERPVSADRLNALIDRMPKRQAEMRRPHAN